MKHPLKSRFSGFWDTFGRTRQEKGARGNRLDEILLHLEGVVDDTDSRIRLVPGYKRKLEGVIENALDYTTGLVDEIPEAIEISRSTFVSNPYVNAFFANVDDLKSVFRRSSEIRDYLDECSGDLTGECCALLCMHMSQKKVLGMELAGNILRKDVSQVAVSFADHRVYSPSPGEQETRQGLKHCLFQGLATAALARIMEIRLENHKLTHEVQKHRATLRRYQRRSEDDIRADMIANRDYEEAKSKLARAEAELMDASTATPQTCMEQVISVFRHPNDYVRMNRFSLKLSKLGIKIHEDSRQPCNDLELTEVEIASEQPRVITLARIPVKELLPGSVSATNGLI
jgi:hypothetical protein